MNGSLFLYVNGKPHTVSGPLAFDTLSTFLRSTLRATGTKIVCEEGDCGACTVLVGRPTGETIEYRPVNSCIQFVYQVHGSHVVTVEGLGSSGSLHPVQDSMVRLHGAQCGFELSTAHAQRAIDDEHEVRGSPHRLNLANGLLDGVLANAQVGCFEDARGPDPHRYFDEIHVDALARGEARRDDPCPFGPAITVR